MPASVPYASACGCGVSQLPLDFHEIASLCCSSQEYKFPCDYCFTGTRNKANVRIVENHIFNCGFLRMYCSQISISRHLSRAQGSTLSLHLQLMLLPPFVRFRCLLPLCMHIISHMSEPTNHRNVAQSSQPHISTIFLHLIVLLVLLFCLSH